MKTSVFAIYGATVAVAILSGCATAPTARGLAPSPAISFPSSTFTTSAIVILVNPFLVVDNRFTYRIMPKIVEDFGIICV